MGISTKSTRSLAVLALALTSSPIGALAQSMESVTVESVTGPNGEKRELKSHTPPGPPPVSNLAPLSELLSVPEAPEAPEAILKPYEALVKLYTNAHIDVLTYHYDNRRSGWNPNEVDLTPKTVASPRFVLLKTLKVDGNVFAQPLLISNFKIKDNRYHDILIIATGHNTVYAVDANTYESLWPNPISLGKAQKTLDVGCKDVQPEYGISSTPVIVRKSKDSATLYVVSATDSSKKDSSKKDFHTFIHALDLTTGKDIFTPKEITPSATLTDGSKLNFSPKDQWSRAGLAYNNGGIYVSIGSHCDQVLNISGWVLKYSESLDLQASFHTIASPAKDDELSSIWMTGFAPAIDNAGNLFVVTGNGDFSPPYNYGESVLKLNGETLSLDDYFTPANYPALNARDRDLGSGGIVLFTADSATSKKDLAAVIGKQDLGKAPVLYLLDRTNLGKNQQNDAGAVQTVPLPNCPIPLPDKPLCGVYGGPAVFRSQNGLLLFVQSEQDVLRSYLFSGGTTPKFTPSSVEGVTKAGYGGSIPVVSSDGGVNGVVWLLRRSEPIELEAYDASTLGSPLCSAVVGKWSNPGYGVHGNSFLTPMVANGRVYAPGNQVVQIFGLAAEGVNTISSACGASIQSKR